MKTPGHTIVLTRQPAGMGNVMIALECTCGAVLHAALFVVDDATNQHRVRMEGHEKAKEHLAATLVGEQS